MPSNIRRGRGGATSLELTLLASTVLLLAIMAADILVFSVERETIMAAKTDAVESLNVIEYAIEHENLSGAPGEGTASEPAQTQSGSGSTLR